MNDDITQAIKDLLTSPKVVEGDEGRVEMRSLSELIAAAKFLRQQEQDAQKGLGVTFKKIVPDGSID